MSTSNIVYNDTFAEKWVHLLAPPEWRDKVKLEFRHVPLIAVDGAGCLIDGDVVDGWRVMIRSGKRIPPLIVCATERGTYYAHDGNHRLEALWHEGGAELVVRVAVLVPRKGFCFRRMNFGKYQTYVLEPVRTWAAPVLRLLLPIVLSAFAVTFTSILPGTSSSPYLVLLLAAVISSAWLAGLRAGLIATILAVGCAAYFLMEPLYSLAVSEVTHLLHLLVAALAMLFFSWIVGTHGRGPSKATMWRG
jgi:hypothetical protein